MKPLRFLTPATEEMLEAAYFYEQQVTNLGSSFLEKVKIATDDIRENPRKWPVLRSQIRKRIVTRFPYSVFYREDPDEIVIIAIMHQHRHPNYWLNRI